MTTNLRVGVNRFEQATIIGGLKGIHAASLIVAERAKQKTPVKTGRLARSIHEGEPMMGPKFVFTTTVGTNVEYARAVEMGSGLYATKGTREKIKIEAGFWTGKSNKKSLAFIWPNGPIELAADPEKMLFMFRYVMHPGVKPRPYLAPALKESRNDVVRLIVSALGAEWAKLGSAIPQGG